MGVRGALLRVVHHWILNENKASEVVYKWNVKAGRRRVDHHCLYET